MEPHVEHSLRDTATPTTKSDAAWPAHTGTGFARSRFTAESLAKSSADMCGANGASMIESALMLRYTSSLVVSATQTSEWVGVR
jgi:hypothetical protein